jgi:hypothetical protein
MHSTSSMLADPAPSRARPRPARRGLSCRSSMAGDDAHGPFLAGFGLSRSRLAPRPAVCMLRWLGETPCWRSVRIPSGDRPPPGASASRPVGPFDVTPQTIRKDLNELSTALLTPCPRAAPSFPPVENVATSRGRMIASEERMHRPRGRERGSRTPRPWFIYIGTTTEAVARALLQHNGLMVIPTT